MSCWQNPGLTKSAQPIPTPKNVTAMHFVKLWYSPDILNTSGRTAQTAWAAHHGCWKIRFSILGSASLIRRSEIAPRGICYLGKARRQPIKSADSAQPEKPSNFIQVTRTLMWKRLPAVVLTLLASASLASGQHVIPWPTVEIIDPQPKSETPLWDGSAEPSEQVRKLAPVAR